MLNNFILKYIKRFGSTYLKNFDTDNIESSLLNGSIVLSNLQLLESSFYDIIPNMQLQDSNIKSIQIEIFPLSLSKKPVKILVKDVRVTICVSDLQSLDSNFYKKHLKKLFLLKLDEAQSFMEQIPAVIQDKKNSTIFDSIINNILNNMVCSIDNLLVQLVDQKYDINCTFSIRRLDLFSSNNKGMQIYIDKDTDLIYKNIVFQNMEVVLSNYNQTISHQFFKNDNIALIVRIDKNRQNILESELQIKATISPVFINLQADLIIRAFTFLNELSQFGVSNQLFLHFQLKDNFPACWNQIFSNYQKSNLTVQQAPSQELINYIKLYSRHYLFQTQLSKSQKDTSSKEIAAGDLKHLLNSSKGYLLAEPRINELIHQYHKILTLTEIQLCRFIIAMKFENYSKSQLKNLLRNKYPDESSSKHKDSNINENCFSLDVPEQEFQELKNQFNHYFHSFSIKKLNLNINIDINFEEITLQLFDLNLFARFDPFKLNVKFLNHQLQSNGQIQVPQLFYRKDMNSINIFVQEKANFDSYFLKYNITLLNEDTMILNCSLLCPGIVIDLKRDGCIIGQTFNILQLLISGLKGNQFVKKLFSLYVDMFVICDQLTGISMQIQLPNIKIMYCDQFIQLCCGILTLESIPSTQDRKLFEIKCSNIRLETAIDAILILKDNISLFITKFLNKQFQITEPQAILEMQISGLKCKISNTGLQFVLMVCNQILRLIPRAVKLEHKQLFKFGSLSLRQKSNLFIRFLWFPYQISDIKENITTYNAAKEQLLLQASLKLDQITCNLNDISFNFNKLFVASFAKSIQLQFCFELQTFQLSYKSVLQNYCFSSQLVVQCYIYFKNNQIQIEISPIQLFLNKVLTNIFIDNGLKLIESSYIQMKQIQDSVSKITALKNLDSINLYNLFTKIQIQIDIDKTDIIFEHSIFSIKSLKIQSNEQCLQLLADSATYQYQQYEIVKLQYLKQTLQKDVSNRQSVYLNLLVKQLDIRLPDFNILAEILMFIQQMKTSYYEQFMLIYYSCKLQLYNNKGVTPKSPLHIYNFVHNIQVSIQCPINFAYYNVVLQSNVVLSSSYDKENNKLENNLNFIVRLCSICDQERCLIELTSQLQFKSYHWLEIQFQDSKIFIRIDLSDDSIIILTQLKNYIILSQNLLPQTESYLSFKLSLSDKKSFQYTINPNKQIVKCEILCLNLCDNQHSIHMKTPFILQANQDYIELSLDTDLQLVHYQSFPIFSVVGLVCKQDLISKAIDISIERIIVQTYSFLIPLILKLHYQFYKIQENVDLKLSFVSKYGTISQTNQKFTIINYWEQDVVIYIHDKGEILRQNEIKCITTANGRIQFLYLDQLNDINNQPHQIFYYGKKKYYIDLDYNNFSNNVITFRSKYKITNNSRCLIVCNGSFLPKQSYVYFNKPTIELFHNDLQQLLDIQNRNTLLTFKTVQFKLKYVEYAECVDIFIEPKFLIRSLLKNQLVLSLQSLNKNQQLNTYTIDYLQDSEVNFVGQQLELIQLKYCHHILNQKVLLVQNYLEHQQVLEITLVKQVADGANEVDQLVLLSYYFPEQNLLIVYPPNIIEQLDLYYIENQHILLSKEQIDEFIDYQESLNRIVSNSDQKNLLFNYSNLVTFEINFILTNNTQKEIRLQNKNCTSKIKFNILLKYQQSFVSKAPIDEVLVYDDTQQLHLDNVNGKKHQGIFIRYYSMQQYQLYQIEESQNRIQIFNLFNNDLIVYCNEQRYMIKQLTKKELYQIPNEEIMISNNENKQLMKRKQLFNGVEEIMLDSMTYFVSTQVSNCQISIIITILPLKKKIPNDILLNIGILSISHFTLNSKQLLRTIELFFKGIKIQYQQNQPSNLIISDFWLQNYRSKSILMKGSIFKVSFIPNSFTSLSNVLIIPPDISVEIDQPAFEVLFQLLSKINYPLFNYKRKLQSQKKQNNTEFQINQFFLKDFHVRIDSHIKNIYFPPHIMNQSTSLINFALAACLQINSCELSFSDFFADQFEKEQLFAFFLQQLSKNSSQIFSSLSLIGQLKKQQQQFADDIGDVLNQKYTAIFKLPLNFFGRAKQFTAESLIFVADILSQFSFDEKFKNQRVKLQVDTKNNTKNAVVNTFEAAVSTLQGLKDSVINTMQSKNILLSAVKNTVGGFSKLLAAPFDLSAHLLQLGCQGQNIGQTGIILLMWEDDYF